MAVQSLIGTLAVSPSLGLCQILDFDKGGKFYLKCHTGGAGWRFIEEFAPVQIGDAIMYRDSANALLLGLVTEIDTAAWEIGVIGEDGTQGYPYPQNVRCIVGRGMALISTQEEVALNVSLVRVIARSIASFVKGA